jgi:hypothetical protein
MDMQKIAHFLGLSEHELFTRFLVLDYTDGVGQKRYYICPARKGDETGQLVHSEWAFSDSPCIFLESNECTIEPVKPRGGKEFYCRLMTSNRNLIGYGKEKASQEWTKRLHGTPQSSWLRTITGLTIDSGAIGT